MSCYVIQDFGDRDDYHAFMVLFLMMLLLLLAFVVWCGVCGVESSSRGDGTSDVVKENPYPRVRWFAFLAVCCPPCSCLLAKLCLLSLLTGTLFVDSVAATVVAVAASRYVIYLNYPFLFLPPPFSLSLSSSSCDMLLVIIMASSFAVCCCFLWSIGVARSLLRDSFLCLPKLWRKMEEEFWVSDWSVCQNCEGMMEQFWVSRVFFVIFPQLGAF